MTVRTALAALFSLLCLMSGAGVSAQTTYIHTDYLGSVVAESNTSGSVTKRFYISPFGKRIGTAASEDPSYTGHVYDGDTDLHYAQQRYYDASIGRFYSNDPILSDATKPFSLGRYTYANQNPYKYIDPDGRAIHFPFIIGIILKEVLAEVASEATGGASDYLSARRMIQRVGKSQIKRFESPTGNKPTTASPSQSQDGVDTPRGGTYVLRDPETDQVRRTGRSNDLRRREGEHGRHPETRDLNFEIDRRTDSRAAQRGREQRIYDAHPEADLNRLRPISPRNPRREEYLREGDRL